MVSITNAQIFNKFSIAIGPVFGLNYPSVTDLNSEMKKIGIPEFPTGGFFSTGIGGFIDIPVIKGLRIGGTGYGYSYDRSVPTINSTTKIVQYSYSGGGITIEYAKKISDSFDYTLGAVLGLGSLSLNISQFSNDLRNWNIIQISPDSVSSSKYTTSKFKTKVYSLTPQAGIGFQAASFLYFKLNGGYMLSAQSTWKLEDELEVSNVPSGIKADGFMFNFGVYVGLFVK